VRPLVSIVIPCFNDGQYLREAIESVKAYPDPKAYEIIVVNDGSSDSSTLETLGTVEREGCQVIHQTNRGLGAARNTGVRASSGTYILPLDSDNRIRAAYISEGVQLLNDQPRLGVVYGDAEYFGSKTGRVSVPEFSLGRMIRENYIDACAVYRRAAWEEVGGYDEQMPIMGWEDWDFWLRLGLKNWGFLHLSMVLFDYRVRSDSIISRTIRHVGELCDYIFSKEELADANQIRLRQREITRLLGLERSPDYRLGKTLLDPLRHVRRVLRGQNGTTKPRVSIQK
jgi:glycosyltransferase involved in cell wall biosynthesis